MNVKILNISNENEITKWNEFALQKNNLYFHSNWSKIISSVYKFKPYYLYIEDSGNIKSIFPLFHVKFPLFKDELVSIPHLESGGISNPEYYKLYFNFIIQNKISKKIKIYQLNEPIGNFPCNSDEVILVKDIPEKKELIISSIKAPTKRRYMRRALEMDLKTVIENNEETLNEFYNNYLQRMREFGTPPHKFEFIKKIADLFKHETRILLIKDGNKVIGAAFYILFGQHIYNLYLVVPKKFLKEKIVYLIQYKAMEMGIEKGLKKLVLGRSARNSGTFFYKTELGGIPVQLYLYNFNLSKNDYSANVIKTIKEKYSYASTIWSKLPPFVSDNLGPHIRKWIY